MNYSKEFTDRFLTKEYGNYEKYEQNNIDVEYKEDQLKEDSDMIYQNYLDMIKKLPTAEREEEDRRDRSDIQDLLTSQEHAHREFSDHFLAWKADESIRSIDDADEENEQNFLDDPANFEDQYVGRMSPFSKEMLYREY